MSMRADMRERESHPGHFLASSPDCSPRLLTLLEEIRRVYEDDLRQLRVQLGKCRQDHEQIDLRIPLEPSCGDFNLRTIPAQDRSTPALSARDSTPQDAIEYANGTPGRDHGSVIAATSNVPPVQVSQVSSMTATAGRKDSSRVSVVYSKTSTGGRAGGSSEVSYASSKGARTEGSGVMLSSDSVSKELKESTLKSNHLRQLRRSNKSDSVLLGPLDVIASIFILLNSISMFMELECIGIKYEGGSDLGLSLCSALNFEVIELAFTVAFTLELLLRLALLRDAYFYDKARGGLQKFALMDAALVLISCMDGFVLSSIADNHESTSVNFLRLLRFARVAKTARLLRVVHLFGKLRVLVLAMSAMGGALFWSLAVLGIIMLIFALALTRLLIPYIEDDSTDPDAKRWIFEYYGTGTRSFNTMFEITFSGCFPNYTRPLLPIAPAINFVFWVYITFVVFGTTRVITALFLKDTFQSAERDASLMVKLKQQQRDAYIQKLNEWFEEADASGDGYVTRDELDVFLSSSETLRYLQLLDLEVHDACTLFDLLDDGDEGVSREEFLRGILQLKGHAREMDVIAIGKECHKLRMAINAQHEDLHRSHETCKTIDSKVTNHTPIRPTLADEPKPLQRDLVSRLMDICCQLESWLMAQNHTEYDADFTKPFHPHGHLPLAPSPNLRPPI